jgi:hypothetical protein
MKHVILMPIWATLFVSSFILGGLCWLYKFSKNDFFSGVRAINTKTNFAKWYLKD